MINNFDKIYKTSFLKNDHILFYNYDTFLFL